MMTKYPISADFETFAPLIRWNATRRAEEGMYQAGSRNKADLTRFRIGRVARLAFSRNSLAATSSAPIKLHFA